jgi:hypothetical protein
MGLFDWLKGEAKPESSPQDWQRQWDSRLSVLESKLGKSDDNILTSPIPIYLGGGADVVMFNQHIDGTVYVTAGLIGNGNQKRTKLGQYELMICLREPADWAPSLLSQLAKYTFEAALKTGQTMDIGPAMPEGSSIAGLLFQNYAQFEFNRLPAGLLLCFGITAPELDACRAGRVNDVLGVLRKKNIYPFTDVNRTSIL